VYNSLQDTALVVLRVLLHSVCSIRA